jgi:hypothetical protein
MTRQALLNFALRALGTVIVLATLTMLGTAIFGATHDALYHAIRPGDVAARMGRGGSTFYVRPWVAALYDGSILVVLGSAALLVFVAYLAKRPPRKN